MIEFSELREIVKNKLSEKRYIHSEGVVKRAVEYAKIYNADIEKIMYTAMAHDFAKEFTKEENESNIKKYNIELDEIEKNNPSLLHQKIGSYICKYEFGFTDDMVSAVRYHTTAKPNMSLIEKIIYLADATEENREYCTKPYVEIIKSDIDQGIIDIIKLVINNLLESNTLIHSDTIDCYNYYVLKKIKLLKGN